MKKLIFVLSFLGFQLAFAQSSSGQILDYIRRLMPHCEAQYGGQAKAQCYHAGLDQLLDYENQSILCVGVNTFGKYAKGGGCNSFGCYFRGGGCNAFGCYEAGGGCNSFGCYFPGGSCNSFGCIKKDSGHSRQCIDRRR